MSDEANSVQVFDPIFDCEDRPAAGTACARCKRDGHFCGAKGYAGEDALCLACGTGQPCGQRVAVVRLHADLGWEEGEVDPRGLHGECRTVAIEEGDGRVDAPAAANGWQAFKQTLSVENLKRGPRKVCKAERKKVLLKKKRDAGRRRRMNELMESRNAAPVLKQDDNDVALCGRGCGKPVHRGSCAGGGGERTAQVKASKRVPMIETISIEDIPRDPVDALESKIRAIEPGSAVRFTAGSPLGAGKAQKAAMAACADMAGLNSKRVDTTVYFWFE